MSHAGTEDKYIKTLFPENMNELTILDAGCGYGATGLYIRTRTYHNGWCRLIGFDPFPEYVNLQKRMGIYDSVFIAKVEDIAAFLPEKSVDITIMQHVIEHIEKPVAIKALASLELVTRRRIIVCTPNGYTESGPLDGNTYNNHVSGWKPEDFKKFGYETRVITKNVNSRLLVGFAKLVFALRGKNWDNEVLVAWKDLT